MKINAGCGLDYRPGYLNIDGFDDTVADRIMPLWDMDIPAACAEEILARQVIEHLGFFRSKHFLSESFRILKLGGVLIIETPDIETSFKQFGASDRAGREILIQWIFGLETDGMTHAFCFPAELLTETVSSAGFLIHSLEKFSAGENNPALRLTAQKHANSRAVEFMAELRKKLLAAGLCRFNSEPESASQETLLAELQSSMEKFYAANDKTVLTDRLILSFENPALIHQFFDLLTEKNILPEKYSDCAQKLADQRFRTELLKKITERPLDPSEQEAGCNAARELLRTAIDGLLSGYDITHYLGDGPVQTSPPEYDFSILNPWSLREQSHKLYAMGVKHLYAGHTENAKKCFKNALKLFRGNLLARKKLNVL